MSENTICTYTLGKLKDEIYKALGEFSRNGRELDELSFSKSDISSKILSAINSAVARAQLSLPSLEKQAHLRFLKQKKLYSLEDFELKTGQSKNIFVSFESSRIAVSAYVSGNGSFKLKDEYGEVIFEEHFAKPPSRFERVKFYSQVFYTEPVSMEIAAGENSSLAVKELEVYDCDANASNKSLIPQKGYVCAALPEDFGNVCGYCVSGESVCPSMFVVSCGAVLARDEQCGDVILYYTPKIPQFDDFSSDDEIIELPDITSLAVVYLAAAELVETGDGELYSRLMYKYRDIALNCYNKSYSPRVENSFFANSKYRLWRSKNVVC